MSGQLLRLEGCRSDVLAHYLKSIAVFRLVATQLDLEVRAFWKDGSFFVMGTFDEHALLAFFLERYQPTPMVAPWNGGSGFYPKDNARAREAIEAGDAVRFDGLRTAFAEARAIVGRRKESPKDEEKRALIASARASWPAPMLPWLDAAIALGEERAQYPALLGTGGNDGRLDFTNNFHQRLTELFDVASGSARNGARDLLRGALLGAPVAGLARNLAIGQFLPGAAGGANASSDFSGDSLVNAWDFVLALEGSIAFQVATVRRLESQGLAQAAAPFAVRSGAAGYASSSAADESARGEQWMPMWRGATRWAEFERMLAEARLVSGRQRVTDALDAATAISRAGTAKGIEAFQRFAFIERNGQANLAVPLGVWTVGRRSTAQLVECVEPWVQRMKRKAQQKGTPASVGRDLRRLESSMFDVLRQPVGARVEELLINLGALEDRLVRNPRWAVDGVPIIPAPTLAEELVETLGDDAETELARGLASQRAEDGATLRAHAVPLDPAAPFRFAAGSDALRDSNEVVWNSHDLLASLGAILHRRLLGTTRFPFGRVVRPVSLKALAAFLNEEVDDGRIARLARGLMLVDWQARDSARSDRAEVSPLFAMLKLAWSQTPLGAGYRADPEIPRLLARGRGNAALVAAERRLAASGLRLRVSTRTHSVSLADESARRMAAALLFPISSRDTNALKASLLRIEDQLQPTEAS